jgi:CRISPR-associated protein Csy1
MSGGAGTDPRLAAAQHALMAGDFAGARRIADAILHDRPGDTRARVLRVNACLKLDRWRDVLADLEHLVAARVELPRMNRLAALCWLRIGNEHKAGNEREAAAQAYWRAIEAAPELQDARHNLGALLLAHERADAALPLLLTVAEAEPHNALAALDLARARIATGAAAEAIADLVRLAAQGDPAMREAAAALLLDAGALDEATTAITALANDAPQLWPRLLMLARRLLLNAAPQLSNAVLATLACQPLDATARLCRDLHAALGLPAVYDSSAQLAEIRASFATRLERLITHHPPEQLAALGIDGDALRWDNFLLAYQGRNDRDLAQRFGDWYATALQGLLPLPALRTTARAKPRVAMVSGRWHQCTAGVYFASWVQGLAARGWEVILVHAGPYRDELTERLARAAQGELTLTGSVPGDAARVRGLEADLAIFPELGMDSTVFALAALRLAPVQVCGWGHPSTTGLPTIDAFVSCAEMEPADAAQHYRERVLLLPGLGTRYPAPELPAPTTRAELGLPDARPLYLIPQSPFKLHPDNDAVLRAVVAVDPDALFVLFADREPGSTQRLRARLLRELAAVSAQPERHLVQLAQRSRADYLRVNLGCDVMIDSLHWSGGNTTLDALHCGVPVVTCPGELMRGRQSAAMLRALGADALIAAAPEDLAARAVALAHDRARRDAIGARLRTNLPQLTDSDEPLSMLDAQLRGLLARAAH